MTLPRWRVPLLLVALVLLAGCGSESITTPQGPSIYGPTATPSAVTQMTCANLASFSGATALTIPQMEFPADTVGIVSTLVAGGTGQFTVLDYQGCTPNSTTDLIVTSGKGPLPFTSLLPFYGWTASTTFPVGGQIQQTCGTAKCFATADGSGFLELDSVVDHGGQLITFHLRRTTPPAAPSCSSTTFADASYHVTIDDGGGVQIPLPPLTRLGRGDGTAGSVYVPACSAGTAASVTAFLRAALPAYGWQPDPASSPTSWKLLYGGLTHRLDIAAITDAANWVLRTHPAM